jgi:predicted enzyme related to lactoylglutathione lyase
MSDWNSQNNRAVWVDIPVADLDRAATFYSTVLGLPVNKAQFNGVPFGVLFHGEGNGGCLIKNEAEIRPAGGMLVYFNVDKRIKDAIAQVEKCGGRVIQPLHAIGPHGFRAIVLDSEGNRLALHSTIEA